MRDITKLLFALMSLATAHAAFGGQSQSKSASWLADLFQSSSASQLAKREGQLKTLLAINGAQDTAWREYLLARRNYASAVNEQQMQEMMEIAAGNLTYGTTLSAPDINARPIALKLTLKQKYEGLYAVLDGVQKAVADRELTPSECGK